MTELDGPIQRIEAPNYTEGPWLHKRGGVYYLTYAAFAHQGMWKKFCYATAPSITGPWTCQGTLTGQAKNSYTIHAGVVEFKKQWYLFYHNATLTLPTGESGALGRRSVCAEYLYYNPDGTIQPIAHTVAGLSLPPRKGAPQPPNASPSMKKLLFLLLTFGGTWPGPAAWAQSKSAQNQSARNPIVFADVPDPSIIRVGKVYYMSSTTMHLSPGVPIMKSSDLVNWQLVSYAYDTLARNDAMSLTNGKSTYGRGSWASSLRYHNGTYYVSTFAQTTGRTHVYSTKNIEKGPWKAVSFRPSMHDHSLFFDDDGRVYMVYGAGKIQLAELTADVSGLKPGTAPQTIIDNASAPAGPSSAINLVAEGSQLFKIKGKYYLFNITWPKGGMRTVIVHRADKLTGPYEGRVALQDLGVAQGGLIDTPDGQWYAYLFRDFGAVGRIPYLVPVRWQDGWPVLGSPAGKVPETLALPANQSLIPGIVASDEFSRRKGEAALPLVWQWNHNPDNQLWSVTERPGYLRLRTGRVDTSFVLARNTLTQRTIGPVCAGSTALDVAHLRDGDVAGLALLQRRYGLVGVTQRQGQRFIVMVSAESEKPVEVQRVPLAQSTVYFKASCDFTDRKDVATFFYSLDGKSWQPIGGPLKMAYTLPHFMGYRFGLFNYATQQPGGYADFDYFRITDQPTK